MIQIAVLFNNMRTLKFKSQLMFSFFIAISHLSGPLKKQKFTLNEFKSLWREIFYWGILIHFVWFWISAPLLVIVIEFQGLHVIEKHSNGHLLTIHQSQLRPDPKFQSDSKVDDKQNL